MKISCLIVLYNTFAFSQVDTLKLKLKVDSLVSQTQQAEFLEWLVLKDQSLRGNRESKINDLDNLFLASYYLNKFGFPNKDELNLETSVIPIVWVHNSIPELSRIAFPIILEGFRNKRISEKDLRQYYLRDLYGRKFNDELYETKELTQIYNELDLNTSSKISINDLLTSWSESKLFLEDELEALGCWSLRRKGEAIKILISKKEEFYIHKIWQDGSHYPQRLIQDSEYENLFRIYENSDYYFAIQQNGKLTIKDKNGVHHYFPTEK